MIFKDNLKNICKGVVSIEEFKNTPGYPNKERMNKGPVPVIECKEEIPCNPCETFCKKKVIEVGEPITNLPKLVNLDACNNCGQCVVKCPGLAIFIVDKTYSKDKAAITIPYEFLPLPNEGEIVRSLNRRGEEVCDGQIIKVNSSRNNNGTSLVKFTVPKEYAEKVRFFKK